MSDDVPVSELRNAPSPAVLAVALLILGLPAYGIFTWVFCRIEVEPEHVAVLVAKTGKNLPDGWVLAREPGYKGIQLEVLKPGRHFRNPLFWGWSIEKYVDIRQGQVGVRTRLYGDVPVDLEQNLLVPEDSQLKGIVAEVLKPGQYPLNPYAYAVEIKPAVEVPAGYVGVVCNRVGATSKRTNQYLVDRGERGVQREVLRQGAHYLNPFALSVYPVDVRSHRLEFSGKKGGKRDGDEGSSAVTFPSSDGFEIEAQLTVEWSIAVDKAPEVFVRIGAGDSESLANEVLSKTLIPAIRGNTRIIGSKYPAANYISGALRTVFQDAIFTALKEDCAEQGIVVHSVLVNDIAPPQDIAGPIREREVAKEELTRNKIQEQQAKAEQSLARETELVDQERVRVLAETEMQRQKIGADNAQRVALIEQEKLLAVAKADLAAAKLQAQAILARGRAEAAVIVANNVAESEALRASVSAFETPAGFAYYSFAQRMAPSIRWVFADPEGPFGRLFQDLLEGGKQ